jgi:MerR family transcriptional regulator, redox-sensitive transcriptional activator SoxR
MVEETLSIGEIAGRARVSVSAIRFYERQGLLPEPERVGGQRRYEAVTVKRLGIIAAAKRAGFSLSEIGDLLASTDTGGSPGSACPRAVACPCHSQAARG